MALNCYSFVTAFYTYAKRIAFWIDFPGKALYAKVGFNFRTQRWIMQRKTILIADDELRIRKLVADFLLREGYAVLEAEN